MFTPEFRGRFECRTEPRVFLERVAERVRDGFLVRGSQVRASYEVAQRDAGSLHVRSTDFWSDYNIGLNDVRLSAESGGVAYEVTYWRWTRGAVVHAAILAATLAVFYFLPSETWGIAAQIRQQPPDRRVWALAIFWGSIGFWGLLWPWLLARLHRGPAERALRRILREVDETARTNGE